MVPISLGSRSSAFTASKTEGTLGCHGNQGVLSVPVRYYLGRFSETPILAVGIVKVKFSTQTLGPDPRCWAMFTRSLMKVVQGKW